MRCAAQLAFVLCSPLRSDPIRSAIRNPRGASLSRVASHLSRAFVLFFLFSLPYFFIFFIPSATISSRLICICVCACVPVPSMNPSKLLIPVPTGAHPPSNTTAQAVILCALPLFSLFISLSLSLFPLLFFSFSVLSSRSPLPLISLSSTLLCSASPRALESHRNALPLPDCSNATCGLRD